MTEYRFRINRNKPILGSIKRSVSISSNMHAVLHRFQIEGISPDPLLTEFSVDDETVSLVIPAAQDSAFVKADDLKNQHIEAWERLRYAFRDWSRDVYTALNQPEILQEIGVTEPELREFLAPANATLWATPSHTDPFHWKCCLGFDFDNKTDNFIPKESAYRPPAPAGDSPEDFSLAQDDVTTLQDVPSAPELNQASSHNPAPPSPAQKYATNTQAWWVGKGPQIALIFCSGFLLAAILGSLFRKAAPCDTTVLEQHIRDMQLQVEQRCNTPQTDVE